MRQSWGDFLRGAGDRSHGVQVYGDVHELAESVTAYLAAGFERNEPGVLVVTPDHLSLFAEQLGSRGWALTATERAGLLVVADAEATLNAILGPRGPEADRFALVVGRLLDRAERGQTSRSTRVFGEMVDLLCGYRLDVFDPHAQSATLPHICREHSHVLPARNYPRFARAVDAALREVLGPNQAATVYVLVSREARDQVPLAQQILMWVSENMPKQADQILASARTHYVPPAA